MANIFRAKSLISRTGVFSNEVFSPNLIYNTGDQTISGNKTFINNITVSGTGTFNAIDLDNIDNLSLSGVDVTLTNSNVNVAGNIFISGNPVLTGVNLTPYATTVNLASTGSTLQTNINNLSGYINSSSSNIVFTTGDQVISGNKTFNNALSVRTISGLSGVAGAISIDIKGIDNAYNVFGSYLGGSIYATAGSGNLAGGSIYLRAGKFGNTEYGGSIDAIASNIYINNENTAVRNITIYKTGVVGPTSNISISQNSVNVQNAFTISGVAVTPALYATITNLASTGSTLDTRINNLSGYINSPASNIVFTTGNQTISGTKTFIQDTTFGDSAQGDFLVISGNQFTVYGSGNFTSGLFANGNAVLTGVDLSSYATTANLALTGSTLDIKINSLSGSSVLLYGDQSVGGVKTFRDNVYINNLFVTGTETIVNTPQINIASNYLLLNLTGGAVDGGIFFVTGSGLTGVNDSGPIIGFDHVNKFKFGISTRNSDLSTLPDIASVQDIIAYSGVADSKFSTITNLASTGNTLEQKISSLSGTLTSTYATITNLASTGSTLDSKINNLSGYINSTSSNIVFTTGNQNISGTKTFTDGILNVSIKPQNSGLEIDNGPFIIRSAAGTFGAARVEILNEPGANGFTVINEGLDLADFGLQSSSNKKINFRMEGREDYANGNSQEFQVIDVSDGAVYYARFGNNNIVIGENTEKVGIGTLSPSEKLEVNGNILANNLVYNTGNQTISGIKTFASRPTVNNTGILLSGEAAPKDIASPIINIVTNTISLDLSTFSYFLVNLNSNITTTNFNNPKAAPEVTNFVLQLSGDGTIRSVTWPTSLRWPGSTAPTITIGPNKVDTYSIFSYDGGVSYYGFPAGYNS